MNDTRARGPAKWLKHLIGGGVTLLCLAVFLRQVNLHDVYEALARFHWPYLFLGLVSLALGYGLRIIRWSMLLRATGAQVTPGDCSAPFLASIALNNVLPLRLGDAVRALVFPKAMGITKTTATSSLIVERLIDLMTLLASLAIGLFAIQSVDIPIGLKTSTVYLAVLGGAALALGFLFSKALGQFFTQLSIDKGSGTQHRRLSQIYATLGELLHGFEIMSRPHLLISTLSVSMLVWVFEAGLFYFVMLGLEIDAGPVAALLVMAVATLSTLVPSSPGYVGSFHLAAFTAIALVGGTSAQAGSYPVVVHLALWLPTTLMGAAAIWANPELFRTAKQQAA